LHRFKLPSRTDVSHAACRQLRTYQPLPEHQPLARVREPAFHAHASAGLASVVVGQPWRRCKRAGAVMRYHCGGRPGSLLIPSLNRREDANE
jgi:hypothetical protein